MWKLDNKFINPWTMAHVDTQTHTHIHTHIHTHTHMRRERERPHTRHTQTTHTHARARAHTHTHTHNTHMHAPHTNRTMMTKAPQVRESLLKRLHDLLPLTNTIIQPPIVTLPFNPLFICSKILQGRPGHCFFAINRCTIWTPGT